MLFAFSLDLDEDVIKVHYHKHVELLCHNLVNVTLEHNRCIGQSKRHDPIFEMTIAGPENRLPFIALPDPHSMVSICRGQLGETSSPA